MNQVMRRLSIVVMLAGCSFLGSSAAVGDATAVDAASDAGTTTIADAAIDGTTISPLAPCTAPDLAGLIACYELEDGVADGTLADSSVAHLDATTAGLAPATGPDGSGAATVGASSMTYTPTTTAFDRAAGYTLAMWVNPSSLPDEGGVYGLLDHELQYAMALVTSNTFVDSRCIHTGGSFEATSSPLPHRWSMLACTWDGTQLCAMRWTSTTDHEHNCVTPTDKPATNGAHGLAIGHLSTTGSPHDHFDGAIDSIHVFDHAQTASQLCAAIGQPSGCLPCDDCQNSQGPALPDRAAPPKGGAKIN